MQRPLSPLTWMAFFLAAVMLLLAWGFGRAGRAFASAGCLSAGVALAVICAVSAAGDAS